MKINNKHLSEIKNLLPEKDRQMFLDDCIEKGIKEIKALKSKSIDIFTDGGSRGNPGPAGGGFAIYQGGKLVKEGSEFFGEKTNNQAEYLALRLALREAYEEYGEFKINCFMDSQLAVEQMNGNYKVKSENVKPLYEEVRRIADQFKSFTITHVRREQNKLADELANKAMDRGR